MSEADVIKNATDKKWLLCLVRAMRNILSKGLNYIRAKKICSDICELYVCYIKYFLILNKTIMTK